MSGVAGRRDTEAVRRTVAEVSALADDRESRFTEMGIDSIAAYRRRRATGEITDDPAEADVARVHPYAGAKHE